MKDTWLFEKKSTGDVSQVTVKIILVIFKVYDYENRSLRHWNVSPALIRKKKI